jgi:hypothetical protein
LNRLPYGGYPGQDDVDRRGKKPVVESGDDPAPAAAPSKKRKLGTAVGGLGVSDGFARELMRTCAAPGGRMSSPELWESSARMLWVTGGWWPKNVPVPRAAGEDFFTSRMVRAWKVFPYGRNIAAVVFAVMDKDRQGVAQKRQAVVKLHEARPKRQRGAAKATAPGGGQPPLAAKSVVPASSRAPDAAKAAVTGGPKSAKAAPSSSEVPEAAKAARGLPPPGKRVADFATDISVDDYLVGKSLARVFFNLLMRRRVGRRPASCCSACRGGHGGCRGAKGEGQCTLCRWRDTGTRCRQGRGGCRVSPAGGDEGGAKSGALS